MVTNERGLLFHSILKSRDMEKRGSGGRGYLNFLANENTNVTGIQVLLENKSVFVFFYLLFFYFKKFNSLYSLCSSYIDIFWNLNISALDNI